MFLLLAGFFLGLEVFNKIDLLVFITAIGIAGLVFYAQDIWHAAVTKRWAACLALVAFLLPMALTLPRMGKVLTVAEQTPSLISELGEKLHTFLALYDGSYFYRLMDVGGLFDKMYGQPAAVYVPLLLVLVIALLAVSLSTRDKNRLRAIGFLVTSLLLTTAGVLLLPGAVRIHHAFLIFPLPQLIIATAFAFLWNDKRRAFARRLTRSMTAIGLFILFATQLYTITRTEKLITETGGRGRGVTPLIGSALITRTAQMSSSLVSTGVLMNNSPSSPTRRSLSNRSGRFPLTKETCRRCPTTSI